MSLLCVVYTSETASDGSRVKRSVLLGNAFNHRSQMRTKYNGGVKRSFDTLDLDALLSDPIFMEDTEDKSSEHLELPEFDFNNLPEISEISEDKDEMSNVIPGAQGPYDFQPIVSSQALEPFYLYNTPGSPFSTRVQHLADSLMDEFMQFLFLKESGMLDQCLGVKRRK